MIIAQKPSLQRRPAAKTVEFIGPDPVFVAFSGGKRPFGKKWRLSSNWPPILYQVINQGLKLLE
jgi:hypothetical protein